MYNGRSDILNLSWVFEYLQMMLTLDIQLMIDQEKQSSSSFKAHQREITLAMGGSALRIQVLEFSTFDEYQVTINQDYIDRQDKFFQGHFNSPQNIFNHLSQHLSEVAVQNSQLKFSYISGQTPQKREAIIPLVPQAADANRKIIKMNQHFTEQLQQKYQRIQALQQNLLQIRLDLRAYKRDTSKRQQRDQSRIARLRRIIKKKDRNDRALEERLQREEQYSRGVEERVQKEEKTVDTLCKFALKPIDHHPDNDHKLYYELTNSVYSTKLTRVRQGDVDYYSYINKHQILPNQHKKYAVRIIKTTDSALMIGFCTEAGLRDHSYPNSESALYDCDYEGYLLKDSISEDLKGCGSVNGDLVECEADLLRDKLRWSKKGKVLVECDMPIAMKGKPLFFSVRLLFKGDSVEVSAYE